MTTDVAEILWPFLNALCLAIGAIVTVVTLPGRLMWGER
jgi:hypothetical protein